MTNLCVKKRKKNRYKNYNITTVLVANKTELKIFSNFRRECRGKPRHPAMINLES